MAGVAFLNVMSPKWLKKIRLKELDLSKSTTCVIGEVYGLYGTGIEKLDITDRESFAFGFREQFFTHYKNLTPVWKKVLKKLGAK